MYKDKIEKFVNYGNKVSDDTVKTLALGQVLAVLIVVGMSYDYKSSFISVIPFTLLAFIFYFLFTKTNKDKKQIFLFIGIEAIIISFTLQVGCFFAIEPMQRDKKIVLISCLILANLFIPLIMILISKLMINRKRELPPAATAGAIAPFAALGTVFAKIDRSNSSNNFHILLAFLACIFLVFHIYFIKYYYAKKLEKISEVIEDESN